MISDELIAVIVGGIIGAMPAIILHCLSLRSSRNDKYNTMKIAAYLELSDGLTEYVDRCSILLNTEITPENVGDLLFKSQNYLFNVQHKFRNPVLIRDDFLQEKLSKLIETNVKMYNSIQNAYNNQANRAIDIDIMSTNTIVIQAINEHIDDELKTMLDVEKN